MATAMVGVVPVNVVEACEAVESAVPVVDVVNAAEVEDAVVEDGPPMPKPNRRMSPATTATSNGPIITVTTFDTTIPISARPAPERGRTR